MRQIPLWIVLGLVAVLAACGEQSDQAESTAEYGQAATANFAEQIPTARLSSDDGYAVAEDTAYTVKTASAQPNDATPSRGVADPAIERKVIYNAHVDLVVDDFTPMTQSVRQVVSKHDGYIASSSVTGSAGESRSAQWQIRVPVGRYDAMLADLEALGKVRRTQSTSQEVTAEYVDLQARIRSKQLEETRLLAHLEEAVKLEDTLLIERELTRVRGEVERLQGRLNLLADLTSMSTITLDVEEIENYIPPIHAEPTYTTQLGRAWSGSITAMGTFFTNLSVVLVAIVPWLIVVVPLALIGYLVLHRYRRGAKAAV